jgi:pyruvate/2-oxoacid:ferredoxin oxidoreductase beta subunit/Pyruvate/2-oxoacid:ferredoxin oxidoreductase gamma subunit
MNLKATDAVIVSDIGCSGLFDTFFNTHAMHGLHGRALTYAAGIKLAQPHLKVLVTMGDGGLGIGGAHLLAACRRNLDLTLLVLNNFNFGMTGGQFSCTTPNQANVASGFLNTLEKPMDVCNVAANAGAPFVARCSVYQKDLTRVLVEALTFDGFAVVDVWGMCPARYTKRNPTSIKEMEAAIGELPTFQGVVPNNTRPEYGSHYRERSGAAKVRPAQQGTEKVFDSAVRTRREVVLLGAAGERVISAGTILAQAAMLAGMHVTQKNDYNITVMRGPSVTELIVSPEAIAYTGVEKPDVIAALSQEGVEKRKELFEKVESSGQVIMSAGVEIPPTKAQILEVDFRAQSIKKKERPLAALSLLARGGDPITVEMLEGALEQHLKGKRLEEAISVIGRALQIPLPDA